VYAEFPKHPRVDEAQFAARTEAGNQVSVFGNLGGRIANHQAPGHAKMHDPLSLLTRPP